MAYQVLARKYRPQRFSDVAGQDHVTRTLLNALSQGRIAHGYIFSGHRGIGKTTIARILAMALNCRTAVGSAERPTPEPCGVCESCTEVRAGNAVDVIEIDAATNRGIDEIRELRDAARYRPARDRYKIYILDEAHQITDAAFNALLKTLEEPPDHVVFMMATTQPEDIPQTIRSRCQHFSFHAVKFEDILVQLRAIADREQITAGEDALALLAEAGDGSMRDALSIMDQSIASAPVMEGRATLDAAQIRELMGTVPNTVFERLMEAIGENQSGSVIEEINRLLNAGNSASQLARQFVRYLRNVLMARIAGEQTELLQLSPDERARAGRSALLFSEEDLTRFLGVMLKTFDELNYRQEPRFHLELGLLKLVHLQRLLPVEQLLSQLGGTVPPTLGGGPLPGASGSGRVQRGIPGGLAQSATSLARPKEMPGAARPTDAAPGAARGATAEMGAEPESPAAAFSPFEQDSRRKGPERGSSVTGEAGGSFLNGHVVPQERPASQGQREPGTAEPLVDASVAEGNKAGKERALSHNAAQVREPAAGHSSREQEKERGSAALATPVPATQASMGANPADGPVAAATLPVQAAAQAPEEKAVRSGVESDPGIGGDGYIDIDAVRERVCAALAQAGHTTAATLLGSGSWAATDAGLEVQVAAKKTMLGLTMNAEAEKICRETMRALADGAKPQALIFVPGNGSVGAAAVRVVWAGQGAAESAQARAMENPLVKQAQELFGAEVRSVVDLRNK